jgi:hypothetical protein
MPLMRSRCALFLSSLLFLSSPAWAEMDDKQALDLVKNQASTEGGTLDAYFENQKQKAKLDLGWKVYPRQNGAFEVERLMLLNEKSPTSFKWVVDRGGKIKPINGKAIGVTR